MVRETIGFVVWIALAQVGAATDSQEYTIKEFGEYRAILKMVGEKKYEGKPDDAVLADIAKRRKEPEEKLRATFERGKSEAPKLASKTAAHVRELVASLKVETPTHVILLVNRVEQIEIVATNPHVVGYIRWKAGDSADLEEEASLIAHAFAKKADGLVDTISLGAIDSANQTVFQAKVSLPSAKRIQVDRIGAWADSRYVRLFEDVKLAGK